MLAKSLRIAALKIGRFEMKMKLKTVLKEKNVPRPLPRLLPPFPLPRCPGLGPKVGLGPLPRLNPLPFLGPKVGLGPRPNPSRLSQK